MMAMSVGIFEVGLGRVMMGASCCKMQPARVIRGQGRAVRTSNEWLTVSYSYYYSMLVLVWCNFTRVRANAATSSWKTNAWHRRCATISGKLKWSIEANLSVRFVVNPFPPTAAAESPFLRTSHLLGLIFLETLTMYVRSIHLTHAISRIHD